MDNIKELLGDEIINIGGKDISLLDLLDVREETVSEDMMKQAALYAIVGVFRAKLDKIRQRAKQKRDVVYAELDLAWREYYVEKDLKITESAISSEVKTDDRYLKVMEIYNEAEERYNIIDSIVRALEMRANMLQSVGAYLRMEFSMIGMHTNEYEETISKMKSAIAKSRQVK